MKGAWIAVLAGALVVVGLLFAGSLIRRTFLLTTADPSVLGLVASNSMTPVTLTMQATHELLEESDRDYRGDHRYNDVDHRLSFTLPAAYVTVIDLQDRGSQRLGFTLWSQSLDPVTPDALEEYRVCEPALFCPNGPVSKRLAAGEEGLRIEVTTVIGTETRRQRVLKSVSGLDRKGTDLEGRPCAIGYDPKNDLITLDAPPGRLHRESCNFMASTYVYRGTVQAVPRHFAKRNPDGSLRYAVKCSGVSSDPRADTMCELQGYFGIWPLFMWVRPSRIDEWDEYYRRVSEFLARHVADRTDRVAETGAGK